MVGKAVDLSGLAPQDQALVLAARAAQIRAWAPYSEYHVGAAVLTSAGHIHSGCNVEISSFSLTCCAERVAVFKAVSEGDTRVLAVAIVTDEAEPAAPCGACRQVLYDFGGAELRVLLANNSDRVRVTHLAELLPLAFGPDNLLKRR